MITIGPIQSHHSESIARLHMAYLHSNFYGIPGMRLLSIYYEAVSAGNGAFGYVAENEGNVVGYVCGVWEPDGIKSALFRTHWTKLLLWGTGQLICRPQIITSFVDRLKSRSNKSDLITQGYELRPIVITPDLRGSGVAATLVEALLTDARSRGYKSVRLFTETDNFRARAFYEKMGFQAEGNVKRGNKYSILFKCAVKEVV
jgi:GNAT superfamily N-acetyltransferase